MEHRDKEERGHTASGKGTRLFEECPQCKDRGHTPPADRGHTPSGNVPNDNVPNDNPIDDVSDNIVSSSNVINNNITNNNATNAGDSNSQNEANVPGDGGRENPPETRKMEGILELVYGVLFEPARTFAGFTGQPPVLAAVVVVVLLNLAEALMGLFTTPQYMRGLQLPSLPELDVLRSMLPLAAVGGFFFSLVKWFFMAGLLHLLAELYGGRGGARGVFTVYGLAGLPAALMIPVQLLAAFFQSSPAVGIITGLLSLAVFIWSVVLLVIGIREVHGFGTGKAALTVFTPALALIVLLMAGLIMIGSLVSGLYNLTT